MKAIVARYWCEPRDLEMEEVDLPESVNDQVCGATGPEGPSAPIQFPASCSAGCQGMQGIETRRRNKDGLP